MYQLNRKALKGAIIAGSLALATIPTIYKNKESNTIVQKAKPEIILTASVQPIERHTIIVYKQYINRWLDGEWSCTEDPTFYIGLTGGDLEQEEYEENGVKYLITKQYIGTLENDYTKEDFKVTKRTYHEEVYEDEYIDEHWEGEWIAIGNTLVLMNSTTLPERCLHRWVLDKVEEEEITPLISETELYQKYDLVIKDGDFTYEPTDIYTTIKNVPDSDYKYVKVGEYQKTERLEQEVEKEKTLYKTL